MIRTMDRHGRVAIAVLTLAALLSCRGFQQQPQTAPRQRLISLSPGVTEILFGVGAFSSLVADSDYCRFPEEAKQLPHVGGFFNINLEAIATLKPDLMILIEDQAILFKDRLEQMGLRVLIVKSKSIDDIVESIRTIGREAGHQTEGERLAAEVEQQIDRRLKEPLACGGCACCVL